MTQTVGGPAMDAVRPGGMSRPGPNKAPTCIAEARGTESWCVMRQSCSLRRSGCPRRRARALEEAGIIAGHREKANLGLAVFLELKVRSHSAETNRKVADALLTIPSMVACYRVSGAADFFVEGALPDLPSYGGMLLGHVIAIPEVIDVRSTFSIHTVRTRGPLPVDHL